MVLLSAQCLLRADIKADICPELMTGWKSIRTTSGVVPATKIGGGEKNTSLEACAEPEMALFRLLAM